MIVAGVGCQSTCSAAEIIALVRQAITQCGQQATHLATAPNRAHLPAVKGAAAVLGLEPQNVDFSALLAAQDRCTTRSQTVLRATGLGSVAEAAALAAAGPQSRLLVPRIASARATCAIAGRQP
jgi:cobalt-precorrin 5A hydrolase